MRLLPAIAIAAGFAAPAGAAESAVAWQPWSEAAFARAKAERRLVLVDLEAVWCHWCHEMERVTYHDAKVASLIGARYVALRVDEDSRPDLAARWEEWGWPATIVLAADGTELARRRGYQEPGDLLALLGHLAADPRPRLDEEPPAPAPKETGPHLSDAQRALLERRFRDGFDARFAGWGRVHKLVNAAPLEWALVRAAAGDAAALAMARRTLHAELALADPTDGGFYQYSTSLDWKRPHFEKIMAIQADAIRLHALGAAQLGDAALLASAKAASAYLERSLTSPEGAFYTSQDADRSAEVDGHAYYALPAAGRRALGPPPVDQSIYARENGQAIAALCALADAGDDAALERARRAAEWIVAHRGDGKGGFRHGEAPDQGGPYLGDTLAMGEALLRLHASTGERVWLTRAEAAASAIARFTDGDAPGFVASRAPAGATGALSHPPRTIDDNVAVARFANLLAHYTGRAEHRAMAERAMRWLAQVAESRQLLPGILLADWELARAPLHVTVVGRRDDARTQALFQAARRQPDRYRRIELWDRREGPLANPDVDFPELPEPAAFACSGHACSLPSTDPTQLEKALARLRKGVTLLSIPN